METSPNVLWIISDQQRAQTLSINGECNVRTPHLDSLARTGVNFTGAVAGFPLCCPFRGSMLTGLYPHLVNPGHDTLLNPKQKTIAHTFADNGYNTFYLGKWHLDGGPQSGERAGTHYVPRGRRGGFGTWLGYENNNAQWDCWLHGHRDTEEIPLFRLQGYETDALTDLLLEQLTSRADDKRPFFGVISVQPPHNPYTAPPDDYVISPSDIRFRENVPDVARIRLQAARELAGYYSMIANIDKNVGRIIQHLGVTGLLEKTHILFFSDHGDMHGSHGQFRKTTAYEEAIRIPLIIAGEKPGCHEVGRGSGNLDSVIPNHVDIAPTTLGLCGIPAPNWMQGTDYSALRLDRNAKKENYPNSAYLQSVVPTGHPDSVNKPWRGIVTVDGYKYVCFERTDWLLFDLNEDPYEQVNLVHNEAYRTLRNRLNMELQKWIDKTEDKFDMPIFRTMISQNMLGGLGLRYQGILFDLDGVICHTDKYHYMAWKAVADTLGIPFDEQVNIRLRGVSRMESLDIILENYDGPPLSAEEKARIAKEKNDRYCCFLTQMSLADLSLDVKETLEKLRSAGIKMAVASSSKNAVFILKQIGLETFFDAVIDGNNISHSKPNPQVFLMAADAIGLSASSCLVVEDAIAGVEAAHAGGMDCAGVGNAIPSGLTKYTLKDITQLINILNLV